MKILKSKIYKVLVETNIQIWKFTKVIFRNENYSSKFQNLLYVLSDETKSSWLCHRTKFKSNSTINKILLKYSNSFRKSYFQKCQNIPHVEVNIFPKCQIYSMNEYIDKKHRCIFIILPRFCSLFLSNYKTQAFE